MVVSNPLFIRAFFPRWGDGIGRVIVRFPWQNVRTGTLSLGTNEQTNERLATVCFPGIWCILKEKCCSSVFFQTVDCGCLANQRKHHIIIPGSSKPVKCVSFSPPQKKNLPKGKTNFHPPPNTTNGWILPKIMGLG